MTIADTPTADGAAAILDGGIDPTMLHRSRSSGRNCPLSGDVLRAYDTYNASEAPASTPIHISIS